MIHPYDALDTIGGQSTLGYEFMHDVPNLDAILVPVSGGGMISGVAIAAKSINPSVKIIAVEPEGKNLTKALKSETDLNPELPKYLNTMAEGIKTRRVGKLNREIMAKNVDFVITISDEEMKRGMEIIGQRMKLVIEASAGASAAAAVFKRDLITSKFKNVQNIGVILCGGNI